MSADTHSKRYRRIVTALVAFCYAWLSAVISFQHTDPVSEIAESGLAQHAAQSLRSHTAAPHFAVAQGVSQTVHCTVCEWQAAHVSPALPLFAMPASVEPASLRVVLRADISVLPTPHASSRAPPCA